jgi:hypothetical protein
MNEGYPFLLSSFLDLEGRVRVDPGEHSPCAAARGVSLSRSPDDRSADSRDPSCNYTSSVTSSGAGADVSPRLLIDPRRVRAQSGKVRAGHAAHSDEPLRASLKAMR